jgi:hypothetical protein
MGHRGTVRSPLQQRGLDLRQSPGSVPKLCAELIRMFGMPDGDSMLLRRSSPRGTVARVGPSRRKRAEWRQHLQAPTWWDYGLLQARIGLHIDLWLR